MQAKLLIAILFYKT